MDLYTFRLLISPDTYLIKFHKIAYFKNNPISKLIISNTNITNNEFYKLINPKNPYFNGFTHLNKQSIFSIYLILIFY